MSIDAELTLTTVAINAIVPYWRNPRNATDADIAKVMRSITEYGYQAPIIVDRDHVIIVGHTRYLALRRLGWTEVPVLVTDLDGRKAREYRLIDNRVGEFALWDRTKLLDELRSFTNDGVLHLFFPELDLNLTPGQSVLDTRSLGLGKERSHAIDPTPPSRTLTCPSCYGVFDLPEDEP